jgi:hypothetical protein
MVTYDVKVSISDILYIYSKAFSDRGRLRPSPAR